MSIKKVSLNGSKTSNSTSSENSSQVGGSGIQSSKSYRLGTADKSPKLFGSLNHEPDEGFGGISADNDLIYVQAEFLIEMLAKSQLSEAMLSPTQKTLIFLYLFKHNAKMGRIIDLFVNIPLSGLELRYPESDHNPILMSYVKDFFSDMWEGVNMNRAVFRAYRDYKIFGFGSLLLSDDFTFSMTTKTGGEYIKKQILDFNNVEGTIKTLAKSNVLSKEDKEEIEDITARYLKDKRSVDLEELQKVVYSFIPNYQGAEVTSTAEDEDWVEKYRGVKFVKNIDPFEALGRSTNDEINFLSIPIVGGGRFKDMFKEGEETSEILKSLEALGYSKSYVEEFRDNSESNINSYPYNDKNLWVAFLENEIAYSDKDKSILNRVLSESVDLVVVRKANRLKANRAYKNIYLFNSDVSGDNFNTIDGLIREAVEKDESSYIFTNKAVTVDNIAFDTRELINIDDIAEKAEDTILQGLGMVEALVGGSDSYANSYLQLEMLGNQFTIERQVLKKFIEEQIFKPVAIKKGLYLKDEWGNIEYLYPKVEFDRLNLAHSSEDFQLLLDLASNKKIPYSYVIKALGFNVHEIERMLIEEQTSPLSEGLANFVTDKILENEHFSDMVIRDKEYLRGVVKALGINSSEEFIDKILVALTHGEDDTPTEEIVEEVSEKLFDKWEEGEEERKASLAESESEAKSVSLETQEESETEKEVEEVPTTATSDHQVTTMKDKVKSIKEIEGVEDFKAKVEKIEGKTYIHVKSLIINKDKRKTGLGTTIMKTLVSFAKANDMGIVLNVDETLGATSKGRLIKFFKKEGLVENKNRNQEETISFEMYLK